MDASGTEAASVLPITERSDISFGSVEEDAPAVRADSIKQAMEEEQAAEQAARADAARELDEALTYVPLPSKPLDPGAFGDVRLHDLLPAAVGERAELYFAARQRAEAALRQQEDTMRQLQFASARLVAELSGVKGGKPAEGWDQAGAMPDSAPAPAGGAIQKVRGPSAASTAELAQRVRGLVAVHEAEQQHPLVVLDATREALISNQTPSSLLPLRTSKSSSKFKTKY